MNTASRMESTCTPGQIQVSERTRQLLNHVDQWRSTGGIEVKGKGLMNTYCWVEGRQQTNELNDQGH
jgi:class 3 adenylate cyclase